MNFRKWHPTVGMSLKSDSESRYKNMTGSHTYSPGVKGTWLQKCSMIGIGHFIWWRRVTRWGKFELFIMWNGSSACIEKQRERLRLNSSRTWRPFSRAYTRPFCPTISAAGRAYVPVPQPKSRIVWPVSTPSSLSNSNVRIFRSIDSPREMDWTDDLAGVGKERPFPFRGFYRTPLPRTEPDCFPLPLDLRCSTEKAWIRAHVRNPRPTIAANIITNPMAPSFQVWRTFDGKSTLIRFEWGY